MNPKNKSFIQALIKELKGLDLSDRMKEGLKRLRKLESKNK